MASIGNQLQQTHDPSLSPEDQKRLCGFLRKVIPTDLFDVLDKYCGWWLSDICNRAFESPNFNVVQYCRRNPFFYGTDSRLYEYKVKPSELLSFALERRAFAVRYLEVEDASSPPSNQPTPMESRQRVKVFLNLRHLTHLAPSDSPTTNGTGGNLNRVNGDRAWLFDCLPLVPEVRSLAFRFPWTMDDNAKEDDGDVSLEHLWSNLKVPTTETPNLNQRIESLCVHLPNHPPHNTLSARFRPVLSG